MASSGAPTPVRLLFRAGEQRFLSRELVIMEWSVAGGVTAPSLIDQKEAFEQELTNLTGSSLGVTVLADMRGLSVTGQVDLYESYKKLVGQVDGCATLPAAQGSVEDKGAALCDWAETEAIFWKSDFGKGLANTHILAL